MSLRGGSGDERNTPERISSQGSGVDGAGGGSSKGGATARFVKVPSPTHHPLSFTTHTLKNCISFSPCLFVFSISCLERDLAEVRRGSIVGLQEHVKRDEKHYKITDFYKFDHVLGEGGFATVYHGTHRITKKVYAIKSIDLYKIHADKLDMLRNEVDVMKLLDHPNIVRLYEVLFLPRTDPHARARDLQPPFSHETHPRLFRKHVGERLRMKKNFP
jgi:serine/threonine protein kinase